MIQVDVTAPVSGRVCDGHGLADFDYSRDNDTVSAWWRGFSDVQSYLDHYVWCVGTEPGRQDVAACHDVGIYTRSTAQLASPQPSGSYNICVDK